ncbi:hypothetical protein Tco_0604799 [Tanacetum coccineum]
MLWHQNSGAKTTPLEFRCHGISGAKLHFADVTPLLEFDTKSLAPRLPVLLDLDYKVDTFSTLTFYSSVCI